MNKPSSHPDTVNDWIIGYLTQSLTPDESQLLHEWLDASEENRKYFSDMQEIWLAAYSENDDVRFDKEKAYRLFLKRTKSAGNRRSVLRPWLYAAAMMTAVFVCGTIAFNSGKEVICEQMTDITIEAPEGSRTKMHLPDGTLVWLNAGSELSYRQDFGIADRKLNLSGEAYFEVTKNKDIPFRVHTYDLDVTVLGTKFNFRNYRDDIEANVSLLEGKVALTTMHDNTILYPDQQALYNKQTGKITVSKTKAAYSAEWTVDRLYFDEQLLPDIVKVLERSYNVKISIADTALMSERFYGNFRRDEQSIEDVMDVLSSTDKMTYTIEKKNIIIALPR